MNTAQRADYEMRNGIAWLSMNRPAVIAVDHAMIDAIHAAIQRAEEDANVSAMVLTDAGHRSKSAC